MKFAADVVEDGKVGIKGQLETAQQQFHRGQVIPMCAGWFGEINEDFDKTINILAQEAATGIDRMGVCPLANTDRKAGVIPVMLQQFRRTIGMAIVRGSENHRLGRLHYV